MTPSEDWARWHSKVTAVQQAQIKHGIEVHAFIEHAGAHVLQALLRSAAAEHGQGLLLPQQMLPEDAATGLGRHAVLA